MVIQSSAALKQLDAVGSTFEVAFDQMALVFEGGGRVRIQEVDGALLNLQGACQQLLTVAEGIANEIRGADRPLAHARYAWFLTALTHERALDDETWAYCMMLIKREMAVDQAMAVAALIQLINYPGLTAQQFAAIKLFPKEPAVQHAKELRYASFTAERRASTTPQRSEAGKGRSRPQ